VGLVYIRLVVSRQEVAYVTAVLLLVALAVVSQNKLDDILDTIVHLMPILVGVETCVIYIWEKNNQRFHPSNAVASTHEELEELLNHTYSAADFPLLSRILETNDMVSCPIETPDLPIKEWGTLQCTEK
jgi:transcriptional regulator with GAF, ATPase, and Fis domain